MEPVQRRERTVFCRGEGDGRRQTHTNTHTPTSDEHTPLKMRAVGQVVAVAAMLGVSLSSTTRASDLPYNGLYKMTFAATDPKQATSFVVSMLGV